MVVAWCKFAAAAICLCIGLVFMVLAVFGVNRFRKALNRMHAAALGDTLGILFIFLGLMIIRGFSLDSLKLFLVILFFWIASPVSGHMISRLEAMTDEDLGEILVLNQEKPAGENQIEPAGENPTEHRAEGRKEHNGNKKKKGSARKGEKRK